MRFVRLRHSGPALHFAPEVRSVDGELLRRSADPVACGGTIGSAEE